MRPKTEMRQRLEAMLAEGEDDFLEDVCSRIAHGDDPRAIAQSMGLSWFVLKEWLSGGERWKRVEFAKGCFADGLVWRGLDAAASATPEDVSVAKLQADHFTKVAGKLSRTEWGDREQMVGGFSGGVTVVIGEVVPKYLADNEAKVIPVPKIIEGEVL